MGITYQVTKELNILLYSINVCNIMHAVARFCNHTLYNTFIYNYINDTLYTSIYLEDQT